MTRQHSFLLTASLSLTALTVIGQNEEYKIHLHSIDTTICFDQKIRKDTSTNYNTAFAIYTINKLLNKPTDIRFVSNRNILPEFKYTTCDSTQTKVSDTLKTGEICEIFIKVGSFDSLKHKIIKVTTKGESEGLINKIDGQSPFGCLYNFPEKKIRYFSISIDGKQIAIPKNAYENLYDPNICNTWHFERKIEAYTSLDGQYIYIYIYGGNAAGAYFSKLIFDKKKYLTKISAGYYELSIHGSFRDDFVGF